MIVLCQLLLCTALSGDLEVYYQAQLQRRDYDGAAQTAIRLFQPQLHCAVELQRARDILADLDVAAAQLGDADPDAVAPLDAHLDAARGHIDRTLAVAQDYVDAGWSMDLLDDLDRQRDAVLEQWQAAADRLDGLRRRARPLASFIGEVEITAEDIEHLEPLDRLLLGLYLVDTGRMGLARSACFVPLRLGADPVLKEVAETASDIVDNWHAAALENRKWFNLVGDGLDATDALRDTAVDRPELAGWMACLTARLARTHYDVPALSIGETLVVLPEPVPSSAAGSDVWADLLAAKVRHERFLLMRRAEQWDAAPPPANDLALFESTAHHWYAAEAALIQAADVPPGPPADAALERCAAARQALAARDPELAAEVDRHVAQLEATRRPFLEWLDIATAPTYRDTRGTVLPDVLIDDRLRLVARVRSGFEQAIAAALENGELDLAFQLAQRGKALAAGRTLTEESEQAPRALTIAELQASNLMSWGTGGSDQIPIQELFIEYFIGPRRAWIFYMLAPGNEFERLRAVELPRDAFVEQARAAVAAVQAGQPPSDGGAWLFGRESLTDLWARLEPLKRDDPKLRRIVVAPDGPLCYLPLDANGLALGTVVTVLPTAAVLRDSRYVARQDAALMWELNRGDLTPEPAKFTRDGLIRLWRGVELPVLLRDGGR